MKNRMKLIEQLERYRGQKTLLYEELGAAGVIALAELVDYSPTAAARFLGYNSLTSIKRLWSKLGLPVKRRNWADTEKGTPPQYDVDWEQLWIMQASREELAPVFEWRLPAKTEYGILVLIGDLHYCNHAVDVQRWLKLRDWIAENEDVRWIGLGDFLDCPTASSPGGTTEQVVPFNAAMDILTRHLEPIAAQCLLMLSGNHEGRLQRDLQLRFCPLEEICKRLKVFYGGRSTHLRIKIRAGKNEQTYDGFVHHGWGSARTAGAQINKLVQTLQWNALDFVAMGHSHSQILTEPVRKMLVAADDDCVRVEQRRIPLITTGCFLRHQRDTYMQNAGYPPGSLGASALHLYVTHKSVHGRM